MDDRNAKIDNLISTLDIQREIIAEMMSVTDEEQKIIDAIKEEIENDINSNFIIMKSNYFETILKKKNIIRKENYVYEIWGRPILLDDTIENDFILTK